MYMISWRIINILWTNVDVTCIFFMINQTIIIILYRCVCEPCHLFCLWIFHCYLCLPVRWRLRWQKLIFYLCIYFWFFIVDVFLEYCLAIMNDHARIKLIIRVLIFYAKWIIICEVSPADIWRYGSTIA